MWPFLFYIDYEISSSVAILLFVLQGAVNNNFSMNLLLKYSLKTTPIKIDLFVNYRLQTFYPTSGIFPYFNSNIFLTDT